MLVVYVDDFKLSGHVDSAAKGWALIWKGIDMDSPTSLGLYLGCNHEVFERVLPDTGATVRGIEYNMVDFLRQCVARYMELTNTKSLKDVPTPL
jgi:hypothetical protein